MSEEAEKKEGFFSNIKNQILTGVGVVLTTLGTAFVDEVKGLVGIEEDEPTEQVQPQQQQQQNNQQVVINIPEQKPAQVIEKTVIVKESPKPKPKKKTETEKRKEEGLDW